ncbi:MAG: hypothetical protein MJ204_02615 [Bacteroidales bacterium]|nr:hypothetical protein [Bacteroidales bacterium]MCQ2605420.1 hypothetical protein [Bacteroidales bacterium]
MDTLKLLKTRLKHQHSEVVEAKKNLGKPGFTKAYLQRMAANEEQTKRMIKKYEK